ncbi:protein serine/threonine phosphatase 2C [Daedaleopsis nitida]|nr:protein serine/threonine phosphatase 2C [Daedaleopsis nitida]
MTTFDAVRAKLAQRYSNKKLDAELGAQVHAVTFQPLATRKNQDRLVVRELRVHDQAWLFLAVCDGHGGATTARYTASHLPSRIRATLKHVVGVELHGSPDRETLLEKADFISSELKRCIKDFDSEIGHVVETICPEPGRLSASEACSVVREYPDVLARACAGTTLAAALVNIRHKLMWTMNVGDSTVALSTTDPDGKRTAVDLCSRHSVATNLRERDRIVRDHRGEDRVIERGRILGSLSVSRVIGDYPFKLHPAYSSHLFRYLSILGHTRVKEGLSDRIVSPPYAIASPSMRFVDLAVVWDQKPIIMLYTDGVDNLVNHCKYLAPWRGSGIVPSRALAVLLQDEVDNTVEKLLGYNINLRWSGDVGNRAVDVLGNLIGGTCTNILQMVLDQHLLVDRQGSPELYIDDTSIIICTLTGTS